MQKFYKVCYPLILGVVIAALVIGVATRISYRNIPEDEAIYTIQEHWEYNKEADEMQYKGLVVDNLVKNIDEKKISKELKRKKDCDVFIVKVKKHIKNYETTKTTATVKRVIKGDENELNNDIIIYEPNFFQYSVKNKNLFFYSVNTLNNLMIPENEYLIFVERLNYDEAYQKKLLNNEYKVDIDLTLYSFPLEYNCEFIEKEKIKTYTDFKHIDYICFNREQAHKLDFIRKNIIKEYI